MTEILNQTLQKLLTQYDLQGFTVTFLLFAFAIIFLFVNYIHYTNIPRARTIWWSILDRKAGLWLINGTIKRFLFPIIKSGSGGKPGERFSSSWVRREPYEMFLVPERTYSEMFSSSWFQREPGERFNSSWNRRELYKGFKSSWLQREPGKGSVVPGSGDNSWQFQ